MEEAISIYPNPVTETLYVKANQSDSSLSANLLSPFGQTIESKVNEGFVEFSVGQLSNGIYFLSVNGKNYKILKTN
jgi:hypothetical protein